MDRSICLWLVISVLVCMGEAKPRKNQQSRPPVATLPPGPEAICGTSTSMRLMTDMERSLKSAVTYVLENRNLEWGWGQHRDQVKPDPFAQFADTASAIISLQLTSGGEWFGRLTDDLKAQLSVKQLEIETLAQLTHFIARLHNMTSTTDRCDHNMTRPDVDGMRPTRRPDVGEGMRPTRTPGVGNITHSMRNETMGMMSLQQLANTMLALNLTCHPLSNFFGHSLTNMLKYRQEMGRNRSFERPTASPDRRPGAGEASCDMMPSGMERNFTYGTGLLLACRSGHEINATLVRCLIKAHSDDKLYMANGVGDANVFLLAMSCIKRKVPEDLEQDFSNVMTRIASYLMSNQATNGSFGNPVRTAFALQALKSAETSPSKWQCERAVRSLLENQNAEGAFGDSLGATLAILPTLAHKSLADINDVKPECEFRPRGGDGPRGDGMRGE